MGQQHELSKRDLIRILQVVDIVNTNVRNLNRALFGEVATGPDDQYGSIGENIATVANETKVLIEGLIADFESQIDG